jgi:hypothetical protein
LCSDLREHFPGERAKDKAQDLLVIGVPFLVRRVRELHLLAVAPLADDLFSRGRSCAGQVADHACALDGRKYLRLPHGVVGLAEFLGDGDAHERADDDGGRGRHGRWEDLWKVDAV